MEEKDMTTDEGRAKTDLKVRRIRFGLLALLVVAAGAFLLIKVLGDDDDSSSGDVAAAPVGLSKTELLDSAGDFTHVAYWVGPQGADQYELTDTPDGRIYVRYLTAGADVGSDAPNFLTVGTYAFPAAKKGLRTAESGGQVESVEDGPGYTVANGLSGNNVYVVFDDQPDLQVEVFSPQPGEARDLVDSGALKPIG